MKDLCAQYWSAFLAGDEAAFRALYDLTYDELFHYAWRLGGDATVARDALQEIFVAIWQRKDRQPPVRDPWVFLLASLRNRLVDEARRTRVVPPPPTAEPSPEDQLLDAEYDRLRATWLAEQMDRLPAQQREALHLRYRVALDYPDLAEVLGVSQQAAYNYVNRGIRQLRKALESAPPDFF
ncbi:sigma-70 family RNA polymerase sigma factor [Neolewinella lacunae]|uniref:Sigma-70 family RNA polymerase sigma factor n=1 Tax=Neolewinella lacunae TaxID=1517758 RepID=A0A923TEP8_9BACT|nr:sigma-70 family RNA polymerase sigma factor [Neolewinella lacunae]MBC6996147.1 sigma-70 family RNA polymerase sigma factor [Neolewinella lacunae]MDN3633999.1 sigma-70 family RNA polymerase sigma factor [Neolewinella lacunae]